MSSREAPATMPAIAGMEICGEDVDDDVVVEEAVGIGVVPVEAMWIVVEDTDGGGPVAAAMDVAVRVYDVCTVDAESALMVVGSEVF